MCGSGGSAWFYSAGNSQHHKTSTAAFIWKSECNCVSTAGWGSRNMSTGEKKVICLVHTHTQNTHTNINICTFLQILKWCIFHKPVHSSFIQPWWIFHEEIKEGGGVALLHHLNDVIPWHNHNTGPMNTTYWHNNCADMCTFCQCALLSPSHRSFGCVPSDLVHRRVPKQEHLHCRACVCLNLQNQLLRGFQERHSKQFK